MTEQRHSRSGLHRIYYDRVVEPLGDGDLIFGSSIYADLLTLSPSASQINALISTLPLGLTNQTGQTVDPSAIGAIADNRLQNIARQNLKGVDLAISYAGDFSPADHLDISANATYLESNQQLSPGQPTIVKAGTIFDPPHWRGSGSVTWSHHRLGLTSSITYIGENRDDRYTPSVRIGSFTSVDFILHLLPGDGDDFWSGIGANLAVTNAFNEGPPAIRNASAVAPPYDATNYPVIGRVVSFSISKRW